MPMGGLIMASVQPTSWRHPTTCTHKGMAAPVPNCGNSGGPKGSSRGSPGSQGGRASGGGGTGLGRGRGKGRPRHLKKKTPRNYEGKHRDAKRRKASAKRRMKKEERRRPAAEYRSRRPKGKNDPGATESGNQNTPGWDTITEGLLDPPAEYYERGGDGTGHSQGPRKPMPDQKHSGRELPPSG